MNTANSQFDDSDLKMSEYEFTDDQTQHIEEIHAILLHISLLMFGIGSVLMFLGHSQPGIAGWITIIGAGLFLTLGVVYFHPLVGFRRVETTAGDDIHYMMIAMDNLRTAFSTATWIVLTMNGIVLVMIVMLL